MKPSSFRFAELKRCLIDQLLVETAGGPSWNIVTILCCFSQSLLTISGPPLIRQARRNPGCYGATR